MSAPPDPELSLLASLRIVESVALISGQTLVDVLLDRLTPELAEERLRTWSRSVMLATGIDLRSRGREHLLGSESFVIMSNHQSHLDVPCLYRALSPKMRMVAKKELFRFPLFGTAMRKTGFVEVDRGDRQRAIQSLHSARALLDKGYHVWIAPEGTRSQSGDLLPFKKGGFMLALEAGARILPVGIHGTREVLPVHAMLARVNRPVGLVIGSPIETRGVARDEIMDAARSAIAGLIGEARMLAGAASGLRRWLAGPIAGPAPVGVVHWQRVVRGRACAALHPRQGGHGGQAPQGPLASPLPPSRRWTQGSARGGTRKEVGSTGRERFGDRIEPGPSLRDGTHRALGEGAAVAGDERTARRRGTGGHGSCAASTGCHRG